MESTNLLNENVLSVMQRRQRAIATRRRAPQLKKARALAARKMAPEETLMRRARRKARNILRAKYAGKRGANYHNLAPADRVQVDKMIEKKLPAIEKLVKRLLPQVRNDERKRLQNRRKAKAAGKAATKSTKSLVSNKIPIKEMFDLAEEVLVEQFIEFLAEADFDRYSRVAPTSVLEDVCVDALIVDQQQLDELVDQMSFGYPINESLDITPVGSVTDPNTRFVVLYHPDKMHYHVELVKLKGGENVVDQPVIAERLRQGYRMVNPSSDQVERDIHHKEFMRRYRLRADM